MALTITFTADDARQINTLGLVVAIVYKHGWDLNNKLICASFAPFENNTVIFADDFGVYSSVDTITPGTVISPSSTQIPAKFGYIYPFADNVFGAPQEPAPSDSIQIYNGDSHTLTFGLLRGITVNGDTMIYPPVYAFSVPNDINIVFTPTNIISVFLSDQKNAGAVVTRPASAVIDIDTSATKSLQFKSVYDLNVEKSGFVQGS